MKIPQKLKKKFHTDYSDKSEFAAKARLLQSIWREEKGLTHEKFGNYLRENDFNNIGKNFLTPDIFEIVKREIANKKKSRKVIQEPRIWTNLLSSQPLAFNLFGELKNNIDCTTKIFQELYPDRAIEKVLNIEFEYSPGRKDLKYTNDSSAFDVFIEYSNYRKEKCFFGIEVKYAENLNDKPSSHKEEYERIAAKSNIFNLEKLPMMKQKPIQQIWRDHLLALSMFINNNDFKVGDFIYLYPNENINCKIGIEKYTETFNKSIETYFKPLTLETIVGVIKKHCSENWINEFEDRYLNFDKINKASL